MGLQAFKLPRSHSSHLECGDGDERDVIYFTTYNSLSTATTNHPHPTTPSWLHTVHDIATQYNRARRYTLFASSFLRCQTWRFVQLACQALTNMWKLACTLAGISDHPWLNGATILCTMVLSSVRTGWNSTVEFIPLSLAMFSSISWFGVLYFELCLCILLYPGILEPQKVGLSHYFNRTIYSSYCIPSKLLSILSRYSQPVSPLCWRERNHLEHCVYNRRKGSTRWVCFSVL